MDLSAFSPQLCLSPLDGRYHSITSPLVNYLSEPALNRARIRVEIEWMIFLTGDNDNRPILPGLKPLDNTEIDYLHSLVDTFDSTSIKELSAFEAQTHHDVKAVEYFIDDHLEKAESVLGRTTQLTHLAPLVHFACTSEDINNCAYALSIKEAIENVWLPAFKTVTDKISQLRDATADLPLLAMTHGQPATPTTLGKEMSVYQYRLHRQYRHLLQQEYLGKMNGATGTFAAHNAAIADIDWNDIARRFVTIHLGLDWNGYTTQIEPHDWQAELYSTIAHINRILHNLCVDMWMYISRGIFAQVPVAGATGSSTMPHKVNPIKFENAEANFEISTSFLDTLSSTLVESRWQRDLTDSTTQRNIGSALGYSLIALHNLKGGLSSIHPNIHQMQSELDNNWEVLGEAIQTAMRAAAINGVPGMDHPYERLKEIMRGHTISHADIESFIDSLNFDNETKTRLKKLTPRTYVGLAPNIARQCENEILQDK